MGDVFLRSYYINYNDDLGTMKLAPRKGGKVTALPTGTIPTTVYESTGTSAISSSSLGLILGIVGGVIGIASTIVGVLI